METKGQTPDPHRMERIVLKLLLDAHSTPIAEADLVRSLDDVTGDSDLQGAVGIAVRALQDAGLVNIAGKLISPTVAAVSLDHLLAD